MRDVGGVPDDDVTARIHPLEPKDGADDVLRAAVDLGGEAQRFEIMDRALQLGGWSSAELGVAAWCKQAARATHLRAIVDSAVDVCGRRGVLEPTGELGRWRLPRAGARADSVGSEYRPATRPRGRARRSTP